ncbi:ABC transporter permease [Treponema primitia]|uniref:ABC transporter permease n=1 Tax=Treponema primitia TaxID=88058 RepID=UPI00145F7F49|nr:ABC transporter permease subunit [Treponema primitia]
MKRKKLEWGYFLLIPGLGYILFFLAGAVGMMIGQSFGFFNYTGSSSFSLKYWQNIITQSFTDDLFYSLKIAVFASFICIVLIYPLSLIIQKAPGKKTIVSLMKIPMFVPALVASLLVLNIIDYHGIINIVLIKLRIIEEPLRMRNDKWGTAALLIQIWKNVPFMMIIMYSAVEGVRKDIIDAARNLGAGRISILSQIVLPLTLPSALISVILVFIRVFNDFIISRTAGPLYPNTLSNLMHVTAYLYDDWHSAACIGCLMLITAVTFVSIYSYISKKLLQHL